MGGAKASIPFGSLVMSFKSINVITKKVASLVSFIAFIGSSDWFAVENLTYWTCEWSMRCKESIDLETTFIKSSECY